MDLAGPKIRTGPLRSGPRVNGTTASGVFALANRAFNPADLGTILGFVENGDMAGLDAFLDHYQKSLQSMRYAPIPVVAAPSGLSMGGGFEVLLHADKVVFHANSVTGLVESLVGVVPGGGGVKEMLYRWYDREGDMTRAAWNAFMNIGYGKTARSPLEAEPLAMFRSGVDSYVMNRDRLLATATDAALEMASNYTVMRRGQLAMPGRDAIHAALHPAPGNALYFVATGLGDGSHKFSATKSEHDAAVAEYLRRLRSNRRKGQ